MSVAGPSAELSRMAERESRQTGAGQGRVALDR